MLKIILKQYIVALATILIAGILWLCSLEVAAGVVALLGIGTNAARLCYKNNEALNKATFAGLCIGGATLMWIYSAIALPVILCYMYGPLKLFSTKMAVALLIGFFSPLWCYLPYLLYQLCLNIS